MAINGKIKQLYDAIKSDGGDVGTEEEFNDWFLRPGEEGYNNRKRVYDTFKSDGADVGANYEEFRDWLGLRPADAGAAASTAAPSAPTAVASLGMVSRDIDAPMEIESRDIIADAINENERLQKYEMAKKADGIDAGRSWDDTKGVWDNFVRIVGGGANESVGSAAPKANVTEHDENMRNLVAERQVLEETRKRRDAGLLKKSEGVLNGTFDLKNNARNIGKGVKDVVTDADFLLNGVIGMQKGSQLIKIDEKIGRGEELTDSELRLVNAVLLQGKVESETTVPHGYTAGQTLAEMAPFMAQMALNPANGAANNMAKAAAKQSIKRFGKKAARRIATGVTISGEIGESAVLANTLQVPSTVSDIESRYIGSAYIDKNGQIAFDGSKDWSDAIYRGEGAAIIENYTELLGNHFGLIKDGVGELVKTGVTKLGGGKLVNQVSDLVTRIGSTKWAQAIGNIEKRANWNGSIGEMLEEEAGIVLNSMFVGDNKISDLVDPEQQIDIALGVGLFGGFVSGIKTAGYPMARYNARRNLNRADVRASELMGDEWDGLRNLIDDAEEGDLSSIVASTIAKEGMTEDKQRAVVDYARALMTSRGYNISSESVREDGMASAEEAGAEDSFDAGYSITDSQEMVDARLEMERQRMKLVSSMSEDVADEFDADPLDALARTYDPEIREIASKYVNARMVYDGMIQRVRDDIDGRIAQSDAMIDGRVNRDTGMIQGATLTDGKEVYVVNGSVAMLDDGINVDIENSDESLIVRDAEGRLEFVAPSQVQSLLAPVDAASEKEAAAEAIRNEIAQSAADKIDGVLHFAPNDVYAVINEDGSSESLTIVGESVDASGVAVDGMVDVMREDGSVVAMNTADIQRMVDESNARRLEERESAEADKGVEADGGGLQGDAAADAERSTALSRIPVDESGEPLYEQVDADTAWDAFVEQSEGDEEIAREVVADIVAEKRKELADAEKALKSIGESKPNASNGEGALTVQERIVAKMALKRALTDARDAVERAKGVVDHWQSIGDTVKRRAEAEAAERRRQAEIAAEEARQAAERERIEAEEAERLKREALNGVPDWGYDTAADARARGYRRAGTDKVDRQRPIASVMGKEIDVKFSDRDIVKGRVAIIDAGELQPSHIQGERNPAHFLDEAQPKERNDAASVVSAQKIASNIRPEEITSSVTAYTGAPTVNSRGEVIQGNSRSDALRLMYESQRESAERYKQYLVDHAADFGLTPEQIVSMDSPVLVNVVDVDDHEAIRLGQFVAQDTESGGVERIKTKNAVQKMGDKIRNFANILLSSTDDEATFAQLVDANGVEVLKWMNQHGFITDTQYASAFDSRGNLTGEAVNDLKGIMYQSIFTGGSTRLEEMFNKMPAKAQRAILATAFRDYDSALDERMIGEIQQSIIAFDALTGYEQFRDATNAEATQLAVEAWKRQYAFDDVSGESYLPSETFSNFALALAAMYKGHTQKHIQGVFNAMYDIIQGTEQDNLFESADKTPKPLADAIRRVLNIDYQPIVKTITDNGTNGDTVLDINSEDGQDGRPGSDADASGAEQDTRVAEPADGGGGTLLSFAERGRQGDIQNTQRRQEGAVTDADIERLNDELTAERERSGDGSYSDAEVSMENDPWSKAWGETLRSKREQRAFAKRERERMRAKAVELSERLGVDIEIIEDNSSLEGKRGRSKGWYSVKDGRISVVIGNHVSVADIEKTVLHEAVAHHGLRELLGEHFDEFLDKVYDWADNSIKERIALLASRNGWNRRVATEEYLAGLAEDTDFENAKAYNGWWGKIKRLFLDMLSAVGFKRTGVELSDNELRYILWRSYKNMVEPGRFRAFEWEAEDVAMKYNLKAGEYAESSPVTEQRVAEAGELYELNDRFNNELNRQIAGDLPQGHVYDMGMPSEYLLSTGIARLPIRLSAKILNVKSNLERHAYNLETLRNLVYAIQKPWAIFSYGDRSKAQNMIIGIEDNGRQFLVGISINPTIKGRVLEINSIRNVFPKNNHEWVNWINEGKLLRVDGKKEIQDIIAKLRMNPVAFDYVDLDNAAKIVENFKNPTIREQNNNAGESSDDGVRYRMGDFTPRDRKIAADVYDKMVSSARFEFSEAMQDSMLGLKKLYEAIKGKKGFRIEEVEGYENAYTYENRMSSTNGNEQHLYFIRKMKPLLKAISDICGNSDSERRILTDYMIAKHGLERNVILAERDAREAASKGADYNDELAKCRQRDYSGLTALTGEKDLATAERVAQQMVDDYERDTDTTELWSRVKSATEATLEKMYTSGLMSEDRFNQVRGMFQHYIPLRGWDETTSNEVYTYLLQDDHATGTSLTKKAGGRSSKADDPIANIAAMADSAISQGNRNIMKQRFLNFVLNNPSDLVSHNELWLEHDAVNDEWRPVFAELDAADTPADVAKKIEAFEARMESLQAQHPDKYKRGSEAVNIPYKVVGNNLREHQVLVRRNGATTVLTINGNPRAAQALNGLTNPDVKAGSHYDEALSVVMYVNRQLSALYTTRNPDFVVSNFMRDMLYSNCMTWVKETPSYALRYHRNFGKFNPAVMAKLLNKYENGTLNSNDYIEHAFEQFMANGGETGFTNLKDIEGHKRAIAKELRRQGNVALRGWSALGMKLDLMNRSVENCARFAAYVTSREMGRSVDRSVYDAKEISVNFNKKGSGGTMAQKNRTLLGKIGAHTSGWGRLLYVFWNAGIQGMTNYGRAAKRNPVKATAAATALFSLGWVIPLLAQAGGGDDDDKNAYYNLPSYIRRSNICFRAGEQWVTIPLPIEYRAIYGLGELAYGAISGNERYSDDELCLEVMAQFSQLLPIDMLEGGGGLSPFIPSAAKPAVEAYVMNKSWTGLPIYKDTGYNKDDPEWTKAYKNADQHLVKASRWLNEVSGGDDFKKGSWWGDVNPAKLEYLLNGMFGGMVSFPLKVVKTVETIGGSREFEWRNIPLANRVIRSGDERTANRRLKSDYYKYKKEAMDAKRLARKYESRGQEGFMEYAEKADFLYNSPEYRRALVFTDYEPDIKALEQSIDDAGDPNVRKMLETDLYSTMREMVNELDGIAQE